MTACLPSRFPTFPPYELTHRSGFCFSVYVISKRYPGSAVTSKGEFDLLAMHYAVTLAKD